MGAYQVKEDRTPPAAHSRAAAVISQDWPIFLASTLGLPIRSTAPPVMLGEKWLG